MRAWRVHEYGSFADKLQLDTVEDPQLESGAIVLKVHTAGLMFADLLNIAGTYQVKLPVPFVPGAEAAGVILEANDDSPLSVGQRVMTFQPFGAFAERMPAVESLTFAIPEGMSDAQAAAFTVNYQTAYFALKHRGRLQPGETVLVHGGAGGVGTASIQLAKAFGASVIATAGSPEKLEICTQCGADEVVNYREDDFVNAVQTFTQGKGADVIVDPVGGDVFSRSTKCIAFEGRLVTVGFACGKIPEIRVNRILVKNFEVTGLYWGNYQFHNPSMIHDAQEALCTLFQEGKLDPLIYKEFPFEELPEACAALSERKSHGKVILRVSHD